MAVSMISPPEAAIIVKSYHVKLTMVATHEENNNSLSLPPLLPDQTETISTNYIRLIKLVK